MTSTPPISTPSPTLQQGPANRHALTAIEHQRFQLERLLKDTSKPAHIPAPPKEKTIRPAREMMKNVQGSSAGAGSGEFHVYKASRRREYERIKLMEEQTSKERVDAEFESKRREAEAAAEAKTAKNRRKRQKQKQAKTKGGPNDEVKGGRSADSGDVREGSAPVPFKKRRLVNGKELVFRMPGEGTDDEDDMEPSSVTREPADDGPQPSDLLKQQPLPIASEAPRVVIHED